VTNQLFVSLLTRDLSKRDPPDGRVGPLDACRQDPELSEVKLIAEPWDLGPGGYQVGRFSPGRAERNDAYRDTVRAYWRGDEGTSHNLRRDSPLPPTCSPNATATLSLHQLRYGARWVQSALPRPAASRPPCSVGHGRADDVIGFDTGLAGWTILRATTIASVPISLLRRTPLSAVLCRRLGQPWPSLTLAASITNRRMT
jgi:hypothetical protein